eukprot:c53035_g1_i1.p1 GENE.c53035_g1_i1~~c53035_g1_i1.p1  ORF type:complete len:149 (+),score=22.22 c53035_g1_i1:47-448(+)
MVNPAFLRILARVATTGVFVLGRAVIQAYKQAAIEGAKQAKTKPSGGFISALSGRSAQRMSTDEAHKILGIKNPEQLTRKEFEEKYKRLFDVNDPKTGGSFYLQSKIFRAREYLESKGRIPDAPPQKPDAKND